MTRKEYRYLLKYLREYYEYWVAFDRVDTNDDRRVSLEEFKAAASMMTTWGIDMFDPEKRFKECDADGKGMILFSEFSDWAIKQSLDLEDDIDQSEFEPDDATIRRKERKEKGLKPAEPADKPDPIWQELKDKLPYRKTDSDKEKRQEQWKGMDMNGNGYLSLAEVDKGMRDVISLPALFDLKPVVMRAFTAAKTVAHAATQHSDDYVTRKEYRYLLKYLR